MISLKHVDFQTLSAFVQLSRIWSVESIRAKVNIKEPSSHFYYEWMGIAVCVEFSSLLKFSLSCLLIANGKVMSTIIDKVGEIVGLSDHIWLC